MFDARHKIMVKEGEGGREGRRGKEGGREVEYKRRRRRITTLFLFFSQGCLPVAILFDVIDEGEQLTSGTDLNVLRMSVYSCIFQDILVNSCSHWTYTSA